MTRTDGFKLVKPSDEDSFIIAYGSNLDEARMNARCPSAVFFGTSVLHGYRMLFKHSHTGVYATIEQDANCHVPVAIYRMTEKDEARLDRFEGVPKFYRKQEFLLPVWGKNRRRRKNRVNGVAYIMWEHRLLGEPADEYFSLLDEGYGRLCFDREIIFKAVEDSIGRDEGRKWLDRFYKGDRA